MTKYTRIERIEAWQWNGPEDNGGIVEKWGTGNTPAKYDLACKQCGQKFSKHGQTIRRKRRICPGDQITKRGGVISDAEFKAQGWKKG